MLKFIAYILCYIFYPLSFIFPRSKDIYVFGAFHGAFIDNPKYLFLYCNEHLPNKHCIWLSTSKEAVNQVRRLGFEAYHMGTFKGWWYGLRAKYWFINCYTSDILFCIAGGATVVNLWHGVPMKCIEFGITKGELKKRYIDKEFWEVFYHPASFRRPDYFASTTPFFDEVFSTSFRIDKSRCLHIGCARNQLLIQPKENTLAHIRKYESPAAKEIIDKISHYRTVYVYMPTWRDSQLEIFANGFDLEQFNSVLQQTDSIALMKPHINTKYDNTQTYSNLIFIDGSVDIYPILPFTDVLITDYSGTIYDYLLMPEKGIILFHYDYDEYVQEREFIFDIRENIAGKQVFTFEELLAAIKTKDHNVDNAKRQFIIDKFWGDTMQHDVCVNTLKQLKILS